ncbi:hypothetical protein XA68_10191 [Ophiocordyceps unilateralis]|uniref:RBR-type E3 ubiquitin transferase n=1 Tax=Ophiocordyceps unilateralis TaxID=268505 RepID=A0A2A9PHQ4_OPHUN|nr:hypothetical protein XA68_10191 [Ophiocordyceps unilateralis]
MSPDSHRDADDDHRRSGRRRRYRSGTVDWKTTTVPSLDSSPHPRHGQVHSHGRRTRRRSRSSEPRTLDATMPPPPPPLARSSMDAYRRPEHWMTYDHRRDPVGGRRRSGRHSSPEYTRRDPGYASAYGAGENDDDDDHIEVVEVVEDDGGSSRYRSGRHSSHDGYMLSSASRRHHGRRRRPRHADDDTAVLHRRHSFSSPAREETRMPDRSESWRLDSRHQQVIDVIEDSRPPVSSKRSTLRRRNRSADAVEHHDRPRASSRSRAGSVSGGPSGILGTIFGSPSSRRASPEEHVKEPKAARRLDCVVCMGDVSRSKAARLKCGHAMCRACLERSFKLSLTDPQHMPPRCCTQDHIPLGHVERIFDAGFKRAWNRKFTECSTRNRLYCPSRKCGEWIKPGAIRRENGVKVARCDRCKTKVCGSCKGKWHGDDECPKDEETARFLAQAQEEGWKRCFRCQAIVELKEGCNHMTCRCGAEFCMICGVKWKGCDCPWFNDGGPIGDVSGQREVPVLQIRGDLHDIFEGDGPPAPAELRNQHPVTMTLPTRARPRGYHEEKLLRRLQGQRDAELARHLQYGDDAYEGHDMMGGVGDIHGVGNAAGHLMNEDYRGGGRFLVAREPARATKAEYSANDTRRRAGSMEQRLADRLSEARPGHGIRARMGPEAGTVRAAPEPRLRQHTVEEELYDHRRPRAARTERVVGERVSRLYEDEASVHAPRGRERREETSPPRSSDMAGLNGYGHGMNRVSQWRCFVEPGIPDGESTVGHA